MDTIVEIDETYVGGKESNKQNIKKNNFVQSHNNKATVVGIIERGKMLVAKVVEGGKAKHILPVLLNNVKPKTTVITDQYTVYKRIGNYDHRVVNHSSGEYVKGISHANTIEGFWSLLKRAIIGIYHYASKKYLQKYVEEFAFRYNTRHITESVRFNLLLSNTENRLTYKILIAK